jgi:CRP/FNR family transcriptional regulator, cyclic AMP receptor protein
METKTDVVTVMQSIPWFQELSPAGFERLLQVTHIREASAGEELFREGDKEDNLYMVLNGRIAIEIYIPHRGRVRIYTAEPLDIFGWSSVTPTIRQRTAAARAVLPSRLLAFDAEGLRKACAEDHDLGYAVMHRLANVVASRLLVTRLQLLDMFASPTPEVTHA